jgi:hypothetical protein
VLLKIGYNVARTRKWPLEKWQESTGYILRGLPNAYRIRLFLQLLIPTPTKKTSIPVPSDTKEIQPIPWRSDLNNVSPFPGLEFEYSMSVWSFRFFIVWESVQATRSVRRRGIAEWCKDYDHRGVHELKRDGVVQVLASPVTVLEAVRNNPTFLDQLSKAKQLKALRSSTNRSSEST